MPGPEAAGAIPPPPASPPAPTVEADATNVIDLTRALARNTSRQDAPMAAAPEPPADEAAERYIVEAEALYISQNMTLSNPQTAAAYRIAFSLALHHLKGALAQGHISEEAFERLETMYLTAMRAPDCL